VRCKVTIDRARWCREKDWPFGSIGKTVFSLAAIRIYDSPDLTRAQRESKLTELFYAEGIDLVFEGEYE